MVHTTNAWARPPVHQGPSTTCAGNSRWRTFARSTCTGACVGCGCGRKKTIGKHFSIFVPKFLTFAPVLDGNKQRTFMSRIVKNIILRRLTFIAINNAYFCLFGTAPTHKLTGSRENKIRNVLYSLLSYNCFSGWEKASIEVFFDDFFLSIDASLSHVAVKENINTHFLA